jgi:hypothetical protein
MVQWQGKRLIAVVSACMTAEGKPDFALNAVEVTHEEYQNGVHYDLVEDRLCDQSYDEPWVHFDVIEAPPFLHPAVRKYLGIKPMEEEPDATQLI